MILHISLIISDYWQNNGKRKDGRRLRHRQPSRVKDDSALFARCRLIKHQKDCLMSSVVEIMQSMLGSKPHLKWSFVEPVSGLATTFPT